ncbi:MAG: hypothetical protein JXR68_12865 [Bacteroidales bacterium]|nr:hypothetical protein [Bacteroidales bacterium]
MKQIIKFSLVIAIFTISITNSYSQMKLEDMKKLVGSHLSNTVPYYQGGVEISESFSDSGRHFFIGTFQHTIQSNAEFITVKYIAEYNTVFEEVTIVNLFYYRDGKRYTVKIDAKLSELWEEKF